MTVIYVPSGESKDKEVNSIKDVIEVTDTMNPIEQNQYKSFKFCNMTQQEETIVKRKYLHGLSLNIGIPIKELSEDIKKRKDLYIPEIGIIYMR